MLNKKLCVSAKPSGFGSTAILPRLKLFETGIFIAPLDWVIPELENAQSMHSRQVMSRQSKYEFEQRILYAWNYILPKSLGS
jgi:hypothetical protein